MSGNGPTWVENSHGLVRSCGRSAVILPLQAALIGFWQSEYAIYEHWVFREKDLAGFSGGS